MNFDLSLWTTSDPTQYRLELNLVITPVFRLLLSFEFFVGLKALNRINCRFILVASLHGSILVVGLLRQTR